MGSRVRVKLTAKCYRHEAGLCVEAVEGVVRFGAASVSARSHWRGIGAMHVFARGVVAVAFAVVFSLLLSGAFGAQASARTSDGGLSDVPVLDGFNRADESPLSDGGLWANGIGGCCGYLKVVSDQLANSVSSTGMAWWNNSSHVFGPDGDVAVTISTKPGSGNNVRLYGRLQNPTNSVASGYVLVYTDLSGTDQVAIDRMTNNSLTALKTVNQEFVVGDKLRLRMVGSSIQAWRYSGSSWVELGAEPIRPTSTPVSLASPCGGRRRVWTIFRRRRCRRPRCRIRRRSSMLLTGWMNSR